MVRSLEPSKQLQLLSTLPSNHRLAATSCSRLNATTSIMQEGFGRGLALSRYYRCRVMERNNFRKASLDLPKVIQ